MDAILRQIEELLLQAVPTVALIFLFYLFLKANFFRPLQAVLAERQARTEGAQRAAEQMQAEARSKARSYDEALAKARSSIYAEQETARRAILEERLTLIHESRNRALGEVRASRERIEEELKRARREMETESVKLGAELAQALLVRKPRGGATPGITR